MHKTTFLSIVRQIATEDSKTFIEERLKEIRQFDPKLADLMTEERNAHTAVVNYAKRALEEA